MRDTLRTIFSGVIPRAHIVPDRWAAGNIIFPATDPVPGALDLSRSPYLIDVLKAWELLPGQGLKKLCAVGPQQTGKTLTWLGGLLWSLDMDPGTSLIYYTSEEVAKKINSHKVEPLLRNIPRFRELLLLPKSHSSEAYHLAENTVYFGGVGSRIASFSARRLVADELDDWQSVKGTDPLKDLEMRSRAYPESLIKAIIIMVNIQNIAKVECRIRIRQRVENHNVNRRFVGAVEAFLFNGKRQFAAFRRFKRRQVFHCHAAKRRALDFALLQAQMVQQIYARVLCIRTVCIQHLTETEFDVRDLDYACRGI